MKTRTVWLTETAVYRVAVDVETDDDNEAVETAQLLFAAAVNKDDFLYDVTFVEWEVQHG